MERRKFIKRCTYSGIGIAITGSILQSCGAIYYASAQPNEKGLAVPQSEFWVNKEKMEFREFVLVKTNNTEFPICLYRISDEHYAASLLKCTHRGCELNVGGGIYSCPCHGSEFTSEGKVIQGPADRDLEIYKTEMDDENVYILFS